MTYSQGGTIAATDYNTFATSVNTVWGTGSASNGYGQSTTLSSVSVAATVSATNWASLISTMDSIKRHQSGVVTGLTQPTAGSTVTYVSTLSSNITTLQTNSLLYNATRGTALPTALGNPAITNAANWATSAVKEFSVTFTSTDTVRYFFNAGGVITSYCSIPTTGGTAKSNEWGTFLANQVGTISIGSNYCSRSGTGGDQGSATPGGSPTLNTSVGFHQLTTTYQTLFAIGDTSAVATYGNNYVTVEAKVGGALYGASSNILYVRYTLYDASTSDTFNATIGTLSTYVGYTPPETTYLANSWGTPGNAVTVTNTQA